MNFDKFALVQDNRAYGKWQSREIYCNNNEYYLLPYYENDEPYKTTPDGKRIENDVIVFWKHFNANSGELQIGYDGNKPVIYMYMSLPNAYMDSITTLENIGSTKIQVPKNTISFHNVFYDLFAEAYEIDNTRR